MQVWAAVTERSSGPPASLFGRLAVEVLAVRLGVGTGVVHDPVAVVGRRVERVELQRLCAGIDDVVPGARRHEHGKPGADRRTDAVQHRFTVAGFDPEEMVEPVNLGPDLFLRARRAAWAVGPSAAVSLRHRIGRQGAGLSVRTNDTSVDWVVSVPLTDNLWQPRKSQRSPGLVIPECAEISLIRYRCRTPKLAQTTANTTLIHNSGTRGEMNRMLSGVPINAPSMDSFSIDQARTTGQAAKRNDGIVGTRRRRVGPSVRWGLRSRQSPASSSP